MGNQEFQSGSGFSIRPLPASKAVLLFGLLYAAAVVAYGNLSAAAVRDLRNYWPVFLTLGLPVGLIILRMLWNVFSAGWFVGLLTICAGVVSIAATTWFSADAAYALVFRTSAFVLLLASLAVGLLATILKTPWDGKTAPYLAIQAGLLMGLAGALAAISGRVEGYVALARGQPQATLTLQDYCLTVVSQDGQWTKVRLPFEDAQSRTRRHDREVGALQLAAQYRAPQEGSDVPELKLVACHGSQKRVLTLFYDAGFVPVDINGLKYRVSFGPTRLTLPFEIMLDYAGDESVTPSAAREYDVALTFRHTGDERASRALLAAGSSASVFGYGLELVEVERPDAAYLAVTRNPGFWFFVAGAAVAAFGLGLLTARALFRAR